MDAVEQGGNVAIAHENFWIAPDQVVVQIRQQPRCAIAAPKGDNGIDVGIGKHVIEIGGSFGVAAGQVAVAAVEMSAGFDPKTK